MIPKSGLMGANKIAGFGVFTDPAFHFGIRQTAKVGISVYNYVNLFLIVIVVIGHYFIIHSHITQNAHELHRKPDRYQVSSGSLSREEDSQDCFWIS